jgi:hypothetical protein
MREVAWLTCAAGGLLAWCGEDAAHCPPIREATATPWSREEIQSSRLPIRLDHDCSSGAHPRLFGIENSEMECRGVVYGMANRRAMRTQEGYVGLALGIAEVGDRIALFKGGKLPFVIRSRGSDWELVGDCYVHGIMHGKALKQDEAGEQDGAGEQD